MPDSEGHFPEEYRFELSMQENGLYGLHTKVSLHSGAVQQIGKKVYVTPSITISASRPWGKILIPDVLNNLEGLVRGGYEVCAVTERSERVRANITSGNGLL